MFKSKRGRIISTVLRVAVAVGALWIFVQKVNWSEVSEMMLGLPMIAVIAGILGCLANQVLFVIRWLFLLRLQSIRIGFWVAFRLHLLGIFYNNCLPSAVGGDFLRAWYVTSHTDKKVEAALSVFVDRLIGISGMITMAVVCFFLVPIETTSQNKLEKTAPESNIFREFLSYWWILAIVVSLIFVVIIAMLLTQKGRSTLAKLLHLLETRGLNILKKMRNSLVVYCNHKLGLLFAFLFTFLIQGVFILGMLVVGRSLGSTVPVKYYFVIFPVTWMIGAVPISIGGLGVWENLIKELFKAAGDSEAIGASMAIIHKMLWLFSSLPGVIIHLCGAHLPKDISIDYGDREE